MSTQTTRLKLTKPATTDLVDVTQHINNNYDVLEASVGLVPVLSGNSLPATPFKGQLVHDENDSRIKRYDGTTWQLVAGKIPGIRLTKTDTQTLTTAVYTAIPWTAFYQTENTDANMWAVGNATRLIAPVAGRYRISGMYAFANNATGQRVFQLKSNAAGNPASGTAHGFQQAIGLSSAAHACTFCWDEVYLAAGDYVEVFANQNSGGNLSGGSQSGFVPYCAMTWIGPAV